MNNLTMIEIFLFFVSFSSEFCEEICVTKSRKRGSCRLLFQITLYIDIKNRNIECRPSLVQYIIISFVLQSKFKQLLNICIIFPSLAQSQIKIYMAIDMFLHSK